MVGLRWRPLLEKGYSCRECKFARMTKEKLEQNNNDNASADKRKRTGVRNAVGTKKK